MVRAEQARTRLARAAVIDAARTLFLARGYGATTIEAISEAADVPEPTVYRLFSSKLGILESLLDVSIVGDTADVPLGDRPPVRRVFEDPSASRRVDGFAAIVADVNARVGPIYQILVGAASADQEAARLLDDLGRQRLTGQRALARSLGGALRPGLTVRVATDIVHVLASPEIYHQLVTQRAWTPDRYRRWLSDTLTAQLLPAGAGAPPGDAPGTVERRRTAAGRSGASRRRPR